MLAFEVCKRNFTPVWLFLCLLDIASACFSMSFIFVLFMLHLLTVCALYVCLCFYVIMLIFVCILCYYICIFGNKTESWICYLHAEQRHTEPFQDWIKLLMWLKLFSVLKSDTIKKKIEKVQERALRFVYDDYTSSYINLLEKALVPSLQSYWEGKCGI
jgi:hypothetical protein